MTNDLIDSVCSIYHIINGRRRRKLQIQLGVRKYFLLIYNSLINFTNGPAAGIKLGHLLHERQSLQLLSRESIGSFKGQIIERVGLLPTFATAFQLLMNVITFEPPCQEVSKSH